MPAFTIAFSAEAHGALLPCDCPLQLIGGVARRATLIQRLRARGPVVLVDAGGWAAGGIYDDASDGDPVRDQLRTQLMAQAMARMGYAAVAWGQDERRAFLPDTGVNSWPATLKDAALPPSNRRAIEHGPVRLLPEWRVVPAGAHTVRIAAFLAPDDAGAGSAAPLVGRSPGADLGLGVPVPATDAVSALFAENSPRAGFSVGLCSLGEEETERLAQAAPGFDLLINAGRRTSTRVAWTVGRTVIANFDYQVQRLGVAEVFARPGGEGAPGARWEIRVRHEPLAKDIPEDPEIVALLAPHLATLKKPGKRLAAIEFFTLPECPYCKEAWPDLERIAKDLAGRVEIVPHFLVRQGADNRFRALHGERELAEARVQAVVFRYYPERFWDWLRWRDKNRDAPWEEGAMALGLLRPRLAGALAAGEPEEILERDFQLALRRKVEGTPTLVIANRTYEGELARMQLLRVLCALLDAPRPEVCATVPACFQDAQCRKRGFIGRCRDQATPQARCDFSRAAVKVPATVLLEKDALWTNHERILEVLLGYLPGLEWKMVDPGTDEGAEMARRLKLERYPAYVLDPVARTEVSFEENLGNAVELREGRLVVKPGLAGASRIAARPRRRGRADLFVSRFSRAGQEAVEVAADMLALAHGAPEVVFHDGLYWQETLQPDGKVKRELAAHGGLAELQDAALALAVRSVAPEKLIAYLRERGKRRGSLFWDRAVQAAGVDVAQVRALAEGPDQKGPVESLVKAMQAEADLLQALDAGGDVVLLGENCEVIPVRSREELRYYLELIGKRRTEK